MSLYRALEPCYAGGELRQVGEQFEHTFTGFQIPSHVALAPSRDAPLASADQDLGPAWQPLRGRPPGEHHG